MAAGISISAYPAGAVTGLSIRITGLTSASSDIEATMKYSNEFIDHTDNQLILYYPDGRGVMAIFDSDNIANVKSFNNGLVTYTNVTELYDDIQAEVDSIASAARAAGDAQTVKVTLTQADMFAGTPVVVSSVPAPGAGKLLVTRHVIGVRNFENDVYDNLTIGVGAVGSSGANSAKGHRFSPTLLTASADFTTQFEDNNLLVGVDDIVYIPNTQLQVMFDQPAFNGDGTIDLYITYSIIIL